MNNKMHVGMYMDLQLWLVFFKPSLVLELEMSYGSHQCRILPVIFLVKNNLIVFLVPLTWVRWFHIAHHCTVATVQS